MKGCNYVLQCILYTVHKIQCTGYRRLYAMYCVHFLIYSELFALFIRILELTVVLIHHIQFIYTYVQSCIVNSVQYVCFVYCLLFSIGFLCVMHTVRFVTVYCFQFTAYIMYNTVYNILQYSYCIHPCQTRRHYSAPSIVLPTDGTAQQSRTQNNSIKSFSS